MKSNGIIWNPSFQADKQQRFEKAQKLVDSEVLRRSDPYVPFRSGILKKSGIAGTVIGSGEIKYTAGGTKLCQTKTVLRKCRKRH